MSVLVWEGVKDGAAAGAVLCAETGPGAAACAAVGAAIGAAIGWYGGKMLIEAVAGADNAATQDLSDAQTDVCTTCTPPPGCGPLNGDIRRVRDELEERYRELQIDKFDLFNKHFSRANPLYVDGGKVGSWEGHIDQFRQKQTNLRNNLIKARELGCPIQTPDADRWSSIEPPQYPNRTFHGR